MFGVGDRSTSIWQQRRFQRSAATALASCNQQHQRCMRISSSSFMIFNVSCRFACVVDSSFLNLGNMQHRQQLRLQPKLAATTAQPQWHPFSFSARPSPLRQQHHQHQSQQHLCNGSSSIQRRQQCSTSTATAKAPMLFNINTASVRYHRQ
jgi:hypothetical protein